MHACVRACPDDVEADRFPCSELAHALHDLFFSAQEKKTTTDTRNELRSYSASGLVRPMWQEAKLNE